MSHVISMPSKGVLGLGALSSLTEDMNATRRRDSDTISSVRPKSSMNPPDPYSDEPKWPAWKVTIAVIVFCAAFWAGIGYLLSRLFGG